jgi:hypothetical protein
MSLNYSFNKRDTPEKTKPVTYYDTDGHTRNLCFAPSNGTKLFLSYAYLISGELSPEEGTITFTTHIITLKGHRLSSPFDSLAAQSRCRITTVEERYAAVENSESFITHITVQCHSGPRNTVFWHGRAVREARQAGAPRMRLPLAAQVRSAVVPGQGSARRARLRAWMCEAPRPLQA